MASIFWLCMQLWLRLYIYIGVTNKQTNKQTNKHAYLEQFQSVGVHQLDDGAEVLNGPLGERALVVRQGRDPGPHAIVRGAHGPGRSDDDNINITPWVGIQLRSLIINVRALAF